MKIQIALPVAALLFGACASAGAQELPAQKPGLWETTMTGAKIPGGSRSMRICQNAASLAEAKAMADAQKKSCSKSTLRKQGNTWIADTDCTFSGMHAVGHTVTTINGDSSFHTVVTTTVGSDKTPNVITIDNKYLGACEPGQKAGVPMVD